MQAVTRNLKKCVILPCPLLVFGTIEDLVEHEPAAIANAPLRAHAMMFFHAFKIALIAILMPPSWP